MGWRAWAASRTRARCARTALARPVCTTFGVRRPRPAWAVVMVVGVEELGAERAGSLDGGERPREARAVLQGLELRLAERIVVADLTRGRLWVLVTPRSASRSATGLEAMLEPRSAWMVSCRAGTSSAAMVAASSCSARVADSRVATIHPTVLRLKTSSTA